MKTQNNFLTKKTTILLLVVSFISLNLFSTDSAEAALRLKRKQRYESIERLSGIAPELEVQINKKSKTLDLKKTARIRLRLTRSPLYNSIESQGALRVNTYRIGDDGTRNFISTQALTINRGGRRKNRIVSIDTGKYTQASQNYEFDIEDTENNILGTFATTINAINLDAQIETADAGQIIDVACLNADPSTLAYFTCIKDNFFKTSQFIVRKQRQPSTRVIRNQNGFYTVTIPAPRQGFRFLRGNRLNTGGSNGNSGNNGGSGGAGAADFGETLDISRIRLGENTQDYTNFGYNPNTNIFSLGFGTSPNTFTDRIFINDAGKLGIGVADPQGYLHIRNGTTTMPTMIIDPGSLTTSIPPNGSIEFDGNDLYLTKNGVRNVLGAQGPQGPAGPQGPQGPAGPAGSFNNGGTINGDVTINGRLFVDEVHARLFNGDIFNGGIFRGRFEGDGSNITNLNVNGSTINNTFIDNGTVTNTNIDNSTIDNTTLEDVTVNGTITFNNNGSLAGDVTLDGDLTVNGTITADEFHGRLFNGDVFNGGVFRGRFEGDGSNITNLNVNGSTINNTFIDNGTVTNTNIDNSTILNTFINNGSVVNADILQSIFRNGSIFNSTFENGTVNNTNINNSTIDNTTLEDVTVNGTITFNNNGSLAGDVTLDGDLTVNGTITADEFHGRLFNGDVFNGGVFRGRFEGDGSGLTNLNINGATANINNGTFNNVTINNGITNNTTINNSDIDNSNFTNGTVNNTNINNSTIDNTTLEDVTVNGTITFNNNGSLAGDVTLDGDLTVNGQVTADEFHGRLFNGDVFNGGVFRGRFEGDGSNITNLSINGSTINNTNIDNGNIDNSQIDNADIQNSTIENSTIKDNTVDGTLTFTDNGGVEGDLNVNGDVIANEFNGDDFIGRYTLRPTLVSLDATDSVTASRSLVRVSGNGGPVNLSSNPQVAAGRDGQLIVIKGMSDTNTVTFEDGDGLILNGGAPFTMGSGDMLTLVYDAVEAAWIELSRSDN